MSDEEIVKKTVTENTGDVKTVVEKTGTGKHTGEKVVYYIFGVLEVLFAFRLIFKILGANPNSGFVSVIYAITHVFLFPFEAIFRSASTTGIETAAVLEPGTIIGMIVYALLAWGIVKLIVILRKRMENET